MATLRALALVLCGGVFLIGVARSRGFLAPPDYVWVGLLLATPLVSAAALVLVWVRSLRGEPLATVRSAAWLLNGALFLFATRLAVNLPPEMLREQALWLVILLTAPVVNALALLFGRPKAISHTGFGTADGS